MKKLVGFIKELWIYNSDNILKSLFGFITLGWISYIANIISDSSIGVLGRFFVISWSVVLVFAWITSKK